MRIAIYARYSDDVQDARSIDDQVRLCREYAERNRLGEVAEIYADYALSGASLKTRPEANRLLADARAGRFDLVLIEALDRISRDQEDVAYIFKRTSRAPDPVPLWSVAEGEISELHIGLKGTMNAQFLRDLAVKVRRGQTGRALAGSCPGGLSYGYRVVRELDSRGELVRGGRVIDEAQAAVIRRIFGEYVGGSSPRAIAAALNRDGVPGPRGGAWNGSTIAGGRGRASGILWNEAYAGRLVYNRTRFVKDPETGRRVSRPNPPDKWVTSEIPDLRIVDEATWAAAQARHGQYAGLALHALHQCRRPKHAFSGLLRCAVCGAGYSVRQNRRLACSGRHERGNCSNRTTILVAELERRVLAGLRQRLLAPDAIAAYVQEYHAERARLQATRRKRRTELEARDRAIGAELDRLIDALAQGLASAMSLKDRLLALESERQAVRVELQRETEDDVVTLHPAAIARYKARVADLAASLAGDAKARSGAIAILREFVDRIDIGPGAAPRLPATITAHGLLPRVLAYATRKQAVNDVSVTVVAGEGFEPPTLGL